MALNSERNDRAKISQGVCHRRCAPGPGHRRGGAHRLLKLGGQQWVETGAIEALSEAEAHLLLEEQTVEITLDLGIGDATATGWGCDFSTDYVRINAHYRT